VIGLDPSPFTLRELLLMTAEKKAASGELAAWHIAMIGGMFGAQIDPRSINPYRQESKAIAEQKKALNNRRWMAAMSLALFGKNHYDGKG
jgi:hypothetical protein